MKKTITFLAVSCAFSTFLCDSYATNNPELLAEVELSPTFENKINAEFEKKYPDILKCFYYCAEHNKYPLGVPQIRDYVMRLDCNFVNLQYRKPKAPFEEYQNAWDDVCRKLAQYNKGEVIRLDGDVSASNLWNVIYKKDREGKFENRLIDICSSQNYDAYYRLTYDDLCYSFGLAKYFFELTKSAFQEHRYEDFRTYLKPAQIFIMLIYQVKNYVDTLMKRDNPLFFSYLYYCAVFNIDPTTNADVSSYLKTLDNDFTKLELKENSFNWNAIENAWDDVCSKIEELYDEGPFVKAGIQGDTNSNKIWSTLYAKGNNGSFVNIGELFDGFVPYDDVEEQQDTAVPFFSARLGATLFELARKAQGKNKIRDAIVYLKAAQIFVGVALEDGAAGQQL